MASYSVGVTEQERERRYLEMIREGQVPRQPDTRFNDFLRFYAAEGLLRRIATLPAAENLVLRGSLLTRQWVKPAVRPARDLDFLALVDPGDEKLTSMLDDACNVTGIDDRIVFSLPMSAVDLDVYPIWEYATNPGTRGDISCRINEVRVDIQVDFGFGDRLLPPAEVIEYPCLLPDTTVCIQAVRPELQLAWKLHGLFELEDWEKMWRPKDLWDIYLIDCHCQLDATVLLEAVRTHFQDRDTPLDMLDRITGDRFLQESAYSRWQEFRREIPISDIPERPESVLKRIVPLIRMLREE